jgi:hypothetical protein
MQKRELVKVCMNDAETMCIKVFDDGYVWIDSLGLFPAEDAVEYLNDIEDMITDAKYELKAVIDRINTKTGEVKEHESIS